jgi:poly-gamma-glutamate synthase PgsB/CapB
MQDWILLALASGAAASVIVFWIWQTSSHAARLKRIPIRVHVNGIRGKSTIVRYVAGALRAHGIRTMAKTTGSDTRIIHPDGSEEPIKRRGAPTILEQINVLRRAGGPDLDAIVFECMALRPEYQQISEQRMIRATDGVIANIRQDHVEELGATRVEIAQSLSATTPVAAPLYTSEDDPQIRAILERSAKARGGWLVTVTGEDISREERQSFGPLDFPENIALAVEIANRHGVPRDVALNGIRAARSDPGASKIHRHKLDKLVPRGVV